MGMYSTSGLINKLEIFNNKTKGEIMTTTTNISEANKILIEAAVDNFSEVSEMLKYLSDNKLHLIKTDNEHDYFCELLDKKEGL